MADVAAIRAAVRAALARSPAFGALDDAARARLAADLEAVVTEAAPGAIADEVDLPAFVADLVDGVFTAQVGASIAQMRAYADLLAGAGRAAPPTTDADPRGPARADLTIARRRGLRWRPPE